jgi:5-methylcytosine-specific restriction endonuclease McrA
MRQTALRRRTGLRTTTPLERTTRLRSNGPIRSTRKNTGPRKPAKNTVRDRFDGKCARCGQDGHSVQHRMPRQMGGSPDPAINRLSNLVWLCGDGTTLCHGAVESDRVRARADGYLIKRGRNVDPAKVSMLLWDGRRVLLDDRGGYREVSA